MPAADSSRSSSMCDFQASINFSIDGSGFQTRPRNVVRWRYLCFARWCSESCGLGDCGLPGFFVVYGTGSKVNLASGSYWSIHFWRDRSRFYRSFQARTFVSVRDTCRQVSLIQNWDCSISRNKERVSGAKKGKDKDTVIYSWSFNSWTRRFPSSFSRKCCREYFPFLAWSVKASLQVMSLRGRSSLIDTLPFLDLPASVQSRANRPADRSGQLGRRWKSRDGEG